MMSAQTYPWQKREAPPSLADAAIALGLPVFPCRADKRPLTAHGFKDATQDPAIVRKLFSQPGAAFIGVPTGPVSGIVVVDVDIKDGAIGQAWLDANAERLVSTRTHKTRSGGWHLVFKQPDIELRNSASKIAPGVDLRATGGYVIFPPSEGYQIADPCEPADMPTWLLEACQGVPKPSPAPYRQVVVDTAGAGGTPYGLAALENECYAVRNATAGSQEFTLNAAALKIGSLIAAGELPENAISELIAAGCAMSSQPGRSPWTRQEIDRKVRRAAQDGQRTPRAVDHTPLPVQIDNDVVDGVDLSGFMAKIRTESAKKSATPKPVSADIMALDGVLKMLIDESVSTAIRPQPFLALGAAICAVGVLAGRKYRTQTDLRTNIYVAALAESGGGKDHAAEVTRRAIDEAGLSHYLGGESLASGRAVLSSVEAHPARLFQIDELGYFLSTVTGKKAASHKAEIWSELLKLYSRAKGIYRGTEYANRKDNPRVDINQPCVCFYGTSTPSTFWKALEAGALADGSLARFLVFRAENDRPERNKSAGIFKPSRPLMEALQTIAGGPGQRAKDGNLPGGFVAKMAPDDNAEAFIVPMSRDAEKRREHNQALEDTWAKKVEGTPFSAIMNRLCENAEKLALVRAVSRHPEAPIITELDVEWGWNLAEHCAVGLMREAGQHLADTEFESRCNRALAIISKGGQCTARDIWRRGLKLPKREMADVLEALTSAGMITATQTKATLAGGRPTIFYSAANADLVTQPQNGDTTYE